MINANTTTIVYVLLSNKNSIKYRIL